MTEPTQRRSRVVVVDDHHMFAHVVALALTNHGFDAVPVDLTDGRDASTLLARILHASPDVLLLDLDLGPLGDGGHLIEPAVQAGLQVVVLTENSEPDDAARAIEAGARGIVPKTSPLGELVNMLVRLLPGDPSPPRYA